MKYVKKKYIKFNNKKLKVVKKIKENFIHLNFTKKIKIIIV